MVAVATKLDRATTTSGKVEFSTPEEGKAGITEGLLYACNYFCADTIGYIVSPAVVVPNCARRYGIAPAILCLLAYASDPEYIARGLTKYFSMDVILRSRWCVLGPEELTYIVAVDKRLPDLSPTFRFMLKHTVSIPTLVASPKQAKIESTTREVMEEKMVEVHEVVYGEPLKPKEIVIVEDAKEDEVVDVRSDCRKGKILCVESPEAFILCFIEPRGGRKCYMVGYLASPTDVKLRRPQATLSIVELPDQDTKVFMEYCGKQARDELIDMVRRGIVKMEELNYLTILENFEKNTSSG